MRNKRMIFAAAAAVPVFALGAGIAYASNAGGNPGTAPTAKPTVATSTATAHPQQTTSQARHNTCQRHGDHWCDGRHDGYQRQATQNNSTNQGRTSQRTSTQRHHGSGYQGTGSQRYGYQGSGQYGSWGNGCCRGGWH